MAGTPSEAVPCLVYYILPAPLVRHTLVYDRYILPPLVRRYAVKLIHMTSSQVGHYRHIR